jgi:hypothetical protein
LLSRRREGIECGSWLANADHRARA